MEISILGDRLLCANKKSRPHTQLLRVMKLTACILVVACLQVSANSYSQTVSFSGKNVSIQAVFTSIEKQTGFSFFFNYALIKDIKPVTLEVVNVPMESALKEVLNGEGLDFYQTGKTVFIVKATKHESSQAERLVANEDLLLNIRGKVTDMQGKALNGASISVKNSNKGTVTDERGFFEIKNIIVGTVLEISFSGYEKKAVKVDKNEMVNVQLSVSTSQLDEMQVIAYGQTNQRMSVGDVTTIRAVDIEKQPINNPLLALEGRVPGMFLAQSNGISNGAVKVQIRGQNSIATSGIGNDPLYVVDGVPYISKLLPSLNTILGSVGTGFNGDVVGSPLSFINPGDIESISVLKDADATAIYGSRAANGAILITTKRGKSGGTTVTVSAQNGWGNVAKRLDLMNTKEYLQMRHEALDNDGLPVGPYDVDIDGTWDTTRYTDWQKTLIGKSAQYNNFSASIAGGNDNTQFLISSTFHRETTVFSSSFSDQKGSVHFSIKNTSTNQRLVVQLTGSYLIDNNQLPQIDLTNPAMTLAPNAPSLYTNDGQLNWALTSGSNPFSTFNNPIANFYNKYSNKTINTTSGALLSYRLLKGLTFSSSLGYTNLQSNELIIFPLIAIATDVRPFLKRSANFGNNNINSWIIEPQLNYKKRIGKMSIDAIIGSTINRINSNGVQLQGTGQPSDQTLNDIRTAASITVLQTSSSVYKYNAGFGRVNINWAEKYLLDFSARRDGSSRFGSSNQFHDFGAIGAGWVFSNEAFVQKNLTFLSFGKIRASYGTTGSDQIGDYKFMNLYNAKSYAMPYQGIVSLVPAGLPNPYLQWQSTKKLEVGMNLGFFSDRILLNANWYQNRSSNQLLPYALPIITGFSTITKNLPAIVQNSGFEFVVNSINVKARNFTWSMNFNISIPNNKLLSFPTISSTSYVIGQPIAFYRAYHYLGVDPKTGVYQFSNGKGGVSTRPDTNSIVSQNVIVKSAPYYYGGIENNFKYKSFQISFLVQFVKQNGPNYFYGVATPGWFNVNQPRWLTDRWKTSGNNSSHQQYTTGFGSISTSLSDVVFSDATYTDASYARLKNVSISWQAVAWARKAKIQDIHFFVQGQNLLTLTSYKGLDPESLSSSALPPLRVYTFGIRASL